MLFRSISFPDHKDGIEDTLHRAYNALFKTTTTKENQNNTLVLYVDGTLTIDQNICYALSGASCNNYAQTKQGTYTEISSNSVTKIPQILIFAKKVNVLSHVNRIDAWIILNEDNAENTLNTCSNFSSPNATECSDTLIFNGPIFAKHLELKRTGGANHGTGSSQGITADERLLGTQYRYSSGLYYALSNDGSIAPAEIFNLRSDAYYWGLSQAHRSGIAEVVYQREVAPRY